MIPIEGHEKRIIMQISERSFYSVSDEFHVS